MSASNLLSAAPAVVEVQVDHVRNAQGHVRVSLCTQSTFLRDCPFVGAAPAHPGSVTVTLTGVPPGLYAAQAFHDDDDSFTLERPLIGYPRKGFGFSRDAPFRFGPPRFADAAMSIGPEGARVVVPCAIASGANHLTGRGPSVRFGPLGPSATSVMGPNRPP